MDKIKKNPHLIFIIIILLVTGFVLAQKFNTLKLTASHKVLADDGEDGDRVSEADDENDDEDEAEDEDKNDDENRDEEKNSEKFVIKTQKVADEEDDTDEVDDDQDDQDGIGEEIKDIRELIAKVEKKIRLVAANGGNVDNFNFTLVEVKNLVTQAQVKLAEGNKSAAENLMEAADDKLENLEESVKLLLGEREDGENETDENEQPEIAREYKNIVAQFVHDLRATMELQGVKGGIGRQVSIVAQAQNVSQERMVELLSKIEERKSFEKFLIGPDYGNLAKIKEEIARNEDMIAILEQAFGKITDANVRIVLQRQIQVFKLENMKLQNYVAATENVPSLFGWIVRLFS